MRRWLCLLCLAVATVSAHDDVLYILVEFSTDGSFVRQDWSGRVEVIDGALEEIVRLAGGQDSVSPDGSWNLIYGRQGQPGVVNPNYQRKGIRLVIEPTATTRLKFTTRGGDFEIALADLPFGQRVKVLGGKVTLANLSAEEAILPVPGAAGPPRNQPPGGRGRAAGELPLAGSVPTEVISDTGRQSEFPALLTAGDELVAAWVEWREDHDVIRVRVRRGDAWGETAELTAGGTDAYQPELVRVGPAIWCVWPQRVADDIDLFAAPVHPELGRPVRLTTTSGADFFVQLAPLPGDRAAVVWMSLREGDANVYFAELAGGRLSAIERVSPSRANDWQPDVAAGTDGGVVVVWDNYEFGQFDVWARRRNAAGQWSQPILITGAPTAEFHATVAVDAADRAWIAYDIAGEKWGKDFGRSYRDPNPAVARGLHDSRRLGVRVLAGGRLFRPADDFARLTGGFAQFAELPQLAFDGRGTPWLIFRHWTARTPTEVFEEFATRLEPEGWSTPWRLDGPRGRNTQRSAVAAAPDGGLYVACAGDLRTATMKLEQEASPIYRVHVAALPPGTGDAVNLVPVEPANPIPELDDAPRRATLTLGGRTYTLVVGDCHRHTDIRGHGGVDASVEDTYRYALDAARLDFVATTDHNDTFGGRWPDGLRPYQWWWTQKCAELYHSPPRFVTLFAYEHSLSPPAGHRNVIFPDRRGREVLRRCDRNRPEDNPPPLLWDFLKGLEPALDIPHTFAEQSQPRAEWNWPNPPVEPLLEIYQGARSSYEAHGLPAGERRGASGLPNPGNYARDALAKGCKYGFVSFSDHGSTHLSYACVWTEEVSRRGIWQAMRDRRAYAASDDIIVRASLAGQPMGAEFALTQRPAIDLAVTARGRLRQIDIVRDGQVVYSADPQGATTWAGAWADQQPPAGSGYYYVRVIQEDPDQPAGDPEMAWGSPFFITRP